MRYLGRTIQGFAVTQLGGSVRQSSLPARLAGRAWSTQAAFLKSGGLYTSSESFLPGASMAQATGFLASESLLAGDPEILPGLEAAEGGPMSTIVEVSENSESVGRRSPSENVQSHSLWPCRTSSKTRYIDPDRVHFHSCIPLCVSMLRSPRSVRKHFTVQHSADLL
jgi:hypothetical protein